jgi:F-type H+-transporting ATPase subunit a
MIITTAIIIVCLFIGTSKSELIPNKIQVATENLFFFAGNIVKTNCGENGIVVFPYIFSILLFIMIGNLVGVLPFTFSFTTQIVVTIGMAILVFISSIIMGFIRQGKRYFRHFCPEGLPGYIVPLFVLIEVMSFLFRPVSLGLRLFANMVSGHIMIKVMASFAVSLAGISLFQFLAVMPIAINVLLNIFKMVVCVLQAYVFAVLSCMYLSESFESTKH